MTEDDKTLMIPLEFWLNFAIRKVKQTAENSKINVDYIEMMIKEFIKDSNPSETDEITVQRLNEVIACLKTASDYLEKALFSLEKSDNHYMINKNGHYFPDNLTWEIRK